MTADAASLRAQAEAWIAQDPDPFTRNELSALLDDEAELADRFGGRLQFGTAGLRGALGAGPNRMNRIVVAQAAAGLAAYLTRIPPAERKNRVAIGYDARHNSRQFAVDTAEILMGAGFECYVAPRILPTPFTAFCVQRLGCDAGVMVTASHNPPEDNGYKVYASNGAQIIPPMDREIEAEILRVAERPIDELPRRIGFIDTPEEYVEEYFDRIAALARAEDRRITVAYTAMHGIGAESVLTVLQKAGFPPVAVVPQQLAPDPTFHTVNFPNPEEEGAMDLLEDLAASIGADVAIANDPDADRVAVSVGGRRLTGDETGYLLGDYVIRTTSGPDRLVANSLVSCSLLGEIARRHGVEHQETLTGFKWIMNAGDNIIYGYEEALGYGCAPTVARDKDGVSAALMVCDIAASLKSEGKTILDRLDEIARDYGYYATGQLSVRVDDLSLIGKAMDHLRANPPSTVLGRPVTEFSDDTANKIVTIRADGVRSIVRPSGTEPKLKCYLQVVVPVEGGDVAASRARGAELLDQLKAEMRVGLGLA